MADVAERETIGGFEPAGDEEPEIVVLGPNGKAPGVEDKKQVVLTPEEYEALKSKGSESSAIREGLSQLSERMGRPVNAPAAEPQQQAGESDADFSKRLEAQLFETGKTAGAIQEAIGRYAGPYFQQVLGTMGVQSRKILEADAEKGPTFKKYKKEIEEHVAGLSPAQRLNPGVWDSAYETITGKHSGDMLQERINEGVQKALKEMGIDPGTKRSIPAAVGTGQGSSMATPEAQGQKRRTQIFLTGDERSTLERSAEIRGLELQTYLGTDAGQAEMKRLKNGK